MAANAPPVAAMLPVAADGSGAGSGSASAAAPGAGAGAGTDVPQSSDDNSPPSTVSSPSADPWSALQAPPPKVGRAEPDGGRHVEGWMSKRGRIRKAWKNRWFVLAGPRLTYFAKQGDRKSKGVVELHAGIEVVDANTDGFVFHVVTSSRTYVLRARTADEQALWMEAVRYNATTCAAGR